MPQHLKSHIVYEFCCPACNNKYIGKSDRNFGTRVQEHSASDKKSLVYNHFLVCEHFNYHPVTIQYNTLSMLNLLCMTTPKLLTTVIIGLNCFL